MNIVSRAAWGARPPDYRVSIPLPSPELWLHHSVSATGGASRIRGIQNFHMDQRGWPDIAYTFLINAAGTIYEGVPPGYRGTHTAGHNTSGHAICLLGNFNTTQPTVLALEALKDLVRHGHEQGWWPATLTGGHRDTRGADPGDCPGNLLYNLIPAINQELEDDMASPKDWTDEEWELFNKKNWSYPRIAGVDIQTALTRIHNKTAGTDSDVDIIVAAINELPTDVVNAIVDRLA